LPSDNYTLSLHDALPIFPVHLSSVLQAIQRILQFTHQLISEFGMTGGHTRRLKIRNGTDLIAFGFAGNLSEIPPRALLFLEFLLDRKSTRLNSSHDQISY